MHSILGSLADDWAQSGAVAPGEALMEELRRYLGEDTLSQMRAENTPDHTYAKYFWSKLRRGIASPTAASG